MDETTGLHHTRTMSSSVYSFSTEASETPTVIIHQNKRDNVQIQAIEIDSRSITSHNPRVTSVRRLLQRMIEGFRRLHKNRRPRPTRKREDLSARRPISGCVIAGLNDVLQRNTEVSLAAYARPYDTPRSYGHLEVEPTSRSMSCVVKRLPLGCQPSEFNDEDEDLWEKLLGEDVWTSSDILWPSTFEQDFVKHSTASRHHMFSPERSPSERTRRCESLRIPKSTSRPQNLWLDDV